MKVFKSFEQRSEEWHQIRMGIATSSQFKRIMGGKGGDITYMSELISQKLTKRAKEIYTSDSMEYGIQTEKQAIANYEFINNVKVDHVAFIQLNDSIGCSPDGLIGDHGLIEIKCPETHTHIKWIINGEIPKDHIHQVLGSLWVTGREWVDFISYDYRLESPNDLFIVRAYANDYSDEINKINEKVSLFTDKMIDGLNILNNRENI